MLVSKNAPQDQPLVCVCLWGNGFLALRHQGVQFRAGKDPVLFLNNPEGYDGADRKEMLDYLVKLNHLQNDLYGDPKLKIVSHNMKWPTGMQTSVPGVVDISRRT